MYANTGWAFYMQARPLDGGILLTAVFTTTVLNVSNLEIGFVLPSSACVLEGDIAWRGDIQENTNQTRSVLVQLPPAPWKGALRSYAIFDRPPRQPPALASFIIERTNETFSIDAIGTTAAGTNHETDPLFLFRSSVEVGLSIHPRPVAGMASRLTICVTPTVDQGRLEARAEVIDAEAPGGSENPWRENDTFLHADLGPTKSNQTRRWEFVIIPDPSGGTGFVDIRIDPDPTTTGLHPFLQVILQSTSSGYEVVAPRLAPCPS